MADEQPAAVPADPQIPMPWWGPMALMIGKEVYGLVVDLRKVVNNGTLATNLGNAGAYVAKPENNGTHPSMGLGGSGRVSPGKSPPKTSPG